MKRFVVLLAVLVIARGAWAEQDSAAEKAGEAATKGAEATERVVRKGAKATVDGLADAGEWIGKKLQEGGEKLEKASK